MFRHKGLLVEQTGPVRLLSGDARNAVFAPVADGSARREVIARRLGGAIALGLIGDGEQLPSEQELATSLNVSTVTLRDALADLRARGLVVTRRGRGGGSFVRSSADALAELSRERHAELAATDLRELGDVHGAVAGAAARLAAERASTREVERLRDLTRRMREAPDLPSLRRLDGRFFIELAAAAQSVRLTRQEIDLQGELAQLSWVQPDGGTGAELARERALVVAALSRRRAASARRLVEEQLAEQTRLLVDVHLAVTRAGGTERGRRGA
jgi:DNA-binding FadR family transcriptional regulator